MPRFAANISMLFTEHAFPERFAAAAHAGFVAVECQFPYDFPVTAIRAALDRNGLTMVLHNLPAGDWAAGERGIACHPDRRGEFRAGIDRALAYADALGVKQLNCLAGIRPDGVAVDAARDTLIENVAFAAARLGAQGIRLLIEPINSYDIPGFFLCGTRQAQDVIAAAGATNVFIQYDVYHMQRMEGELAGTLERNLAAIGHIQIADNPGRHEPGTGEINYPFLFALLDRLGYDDWVGCEYKPLTRTEAGLDWLAPYPQRHGGAT